MSTPSQIGLLQRIVNNLRLAPLKQGPFNLDELQALGLLRGKIGPSGVVGIRIEASEALNDLADAIFSDTVYQRGTTFAAIVQKLSDTVIVNYADKVGSTITGSDVAFLRNQIADWFRDQTAEREFYVPCFISPWYTFLFSIGPVTFEHVQDFARVAEQEAGAIFDLTFKRVFERMASANATWIAKVTVEGCTDERAREIADLAVDIGLAALQVFLPEQDAHRIARLTARTMPVFSEAVSRVDGSLSSSMTNSQPGRAFGPGFLDDRLKNARSVLNSFGRRIGAFVSGNYCLPNLEQAWCDAAYWFHEGLAEPLDTMAVPKLETAIEVLLRSESTKGSKARVIQAIQIFYGKHANELINPQSQTTVERFAQEFVRNRSRILHGTWSTLNHSLRESRSGVTPLVAELLACYSLALDQYLTSATPADQIEHFLSFSRTWHQSQESTTAPV